MSHKGMVFLAASIGGGREMLPFTRLIFEELLRRGYDVPSVHNVADDPVGAFVERIGDPTATTPVHFRRWNNLWIEQCKFFVAEVSIASSGLGSEFERCLLRQRLGLPPAPMLLLYRYDKRVSDHLRGVEKWEEDYVWFRPYINFNGIVAALDEFLAAFEK